MYKFFSPLLTRHCRRAYCYPPNPLEGSCQTVPARRPIMQPSELLQAGGGGGLGSRVQHVATTTHQQAARQNLTSEILVWRSGVPPSTPLGADAWCSKQSSHEIQPGQIPTFLIEHTAPPSSCVLPFRPLGANSQLLQWERAASGPSL